MNREAHFAALGWYPSSPFEVEAWLERFPASPEPPTSAVAALVPHAGWAYSGPTAWRLYSELRIPERVIVLCPAHQAGGAPVALWPQGLWMTPLGPVPVDDVFGEALLAACPLVQADLRAHMGEHAIEIQLPFLKRLNPDVTIVPLRVRQLSLEQAETLADALAELVRRFDGEEPRTLLLASSDMSHESGDAFVRAQDKPARERLAALDAAGLYETVRAHDITMCGVLPAVVAWRAARALGADATREVAYATSFEVSGREDYVVGYCAMRADRR